VSIGKVLLWSCLGLFLPLTVLYFVYPIFFNGNLKSLPLLAYDPTALSSQVSTRAGSEQSITALESSNQFAAIESDEFLDPQAGRGFFVSVAFRLEELPKVGKPQKIIAKYDSKNHPYPGWALGVAKYPTSTRPAVFWRDKLGVGEWFPFEEVKLELNLWYQLSLVYDKNKTLRVFFQPLGLKRSVVPEEASQSPWLGASPVQYLGGYNMDHIGVPQTTARLYFGSRSSLPKSFRGEIEAIVLGKPLAGMHSNEEFQQFFSDGAQTFLAKIPAKDVYLQITPEAKDVSRFKRAVIVEGQKP